MTLLNVLLTAIAFLVAIPVMMLAIEIFAAPLMPTKSAIPLDVSRGSAAVLVPAHNEAETIHETLRSIRSQLRAGDRLIVIADNCTDDTARVAQALGAMVVERNEPCLRGKGYALNYGLSFLENSPPSVVVIIDADCVLHPGSLDQLVYKAEVEQRPIQGVDLMTSSPEGSSLNQSVAEFAWLLKNFVRPLGLAVLGQPCQLMGTGMAFPWRLLRNTALAGEHLAEDMMLGVALALTGYPPVFCLSAKVTTHFPASEQAAITQRKRWVHGHLALIQSEVVRLIRMAIEKRCVALMVMAFDLCIPPLTLMLLIIMLSSAGLLIAFMLGASVVPFYVSILSALLFGVSIVWAWWRFGREAMPSAVFLAIPFYVFSKIPILVSFFLKRQNSWVRTDRTKNPSVRGDS